MTQDVLTPNGAGKGVGSSAPKVKFALIDNGSLAPEPHLLLRRVAAEISRASGVTVEAVSWKHSDRARLPDGTVAPVLKTWVAKQLAAGAAEFVFIPFFVSPQGAIAGALRGDLEKLDVEFRFSDGLGRAVLGRILAESIDEVIASNGLIAPDVIVVDHGGPSPLSAEVRNEAAALARRSLRLPISGLTAASMETPDAADPQFAHNHPLLENCLRELAALPPEAQSAQSPAAKPIVIAPLFLGPGRHAGPLGDLSHIAAAAAPGRRIFFAEPIGAHPLVAATLAAALQAHLPVST